MAKKASATTPEPVLAADLETPEIIPGQLSIAVPDAVSIWEDEPYLGGYAAKQCPERVRKDYSAFYDDELKVADSDAVLARMEDGNVFEAHLETRFKDLLDGSEAVFLTGDRTPESLLAREAATLEAMRSGAKFIFNARLPRIPELRKSGEPDWLELVGELPEGGFHYRAGDAKHHKEMEGTAAAKPYMVAPLATPYLADAVETNLVGTPQQKDSQQLAHYHRMLQALGFAPADEDHEVWGGIVGKSETVVYRRLDLPLYLHTDADGVKRRMSALEIEDKEFALRRRINQRENDRLSDGGLLPLVGPELKSECAECPWRQVCDDELEESDDISLLKGMTPARAKSYREAGLTRRTQLLRLDWATASLADVKLPVSEIILAAKAAEPERAAASLVAEFTTGKKAAAAAEVLAAAAITTVEELSRLDTRTATLAATGLSGLPGFIDQARVVKVGKVHRARGVEYVAFKRASIELDIDIEDKPGHVYMIGVLASGRKKVGEHVKLRSEYECFVTWEGTDEGEAKVFAEFWEYLTGMIAYAKSKRWGIKAYHYTQHEDHAFKALAIKHAGKPGIPPLAEVEAFLDSDKWVDLYPICSQQLLWPTRDVTVKSIAKWVRHSWSEDGANGAQSIAWYAEATNDPDPAVRAANQERLRIYNKDDNIATLKVRDWITLLGETRRPGDRMPSVAVLDERFRPRPVKPKRK